MPLMGSLYIGNSGLQTSQNALNTTAHNITNADTKGYVRQQELLGDKKYNTIAINGTGIANKQLGLGVTYNQVRQVRDYFLDKTYREENGRLAFYETEYDAIGEIENLLGEMDGASFEESINSLWVSVQELSKDPSSSVIQGLLMQRSYSFLSDSQKVYDGLCRYQDNMDRDIKLTVDKINDMGHKIWELNESIRKIEAGKIEHANDLKDQRNQLLDELSGLVQVEYYDDAMGNVLVKLEGHMFVTPDKVNEMATQIDETTGFNDVFWKDDAKYTFGDKGERKYEAKTALVFDTNQEISSALDTDLGKLKALVVTRGDHRADFTDLEAKYDENGNMIESAEAAYGKISNSSVMTVMAEFDKLVHATVTAINGALEEAFKAGDGEYMSDGEGNPLQIFLRTAAEVGEAEDLNNVDSLFTVSKLIINQDLMQVPTKLSFVKKDGAVDYDTAEKLKAAFEDAEYALNPTTGTKLNINNFYAAMVAQLANDGAVVKNVTETQQITVDSTESARQQVIGVSTDEELSNMIRFQNAYNASSRYINVISEMLEHLVNTLGA